MKSKQSGRFVRKKQPISTHPTMYGNILVNWENENSFSCPYCESDGLAFYNHPDLSRKVDVHCRKCKKRFGLDCRNKGYIFGYQPDMSCPNPLCHKQRPEQFKNKEWIFRNRHSKDGKGNSYKCRWCKVSFAGGTEHHASWFFDKSIKKFDFENDYWDFRVFIKDPAKKGMSFQRLKPDWYKHEVKAYIYQLLRSKKSESANTVAHVNSALTAFGDILAAFSVNQKSDISRQEILNFLDSMHERSPGTINGKIRILRDFLDWLNLDTYLLIKQRDFPKLIASETDWLDEDVRSQIKSNLHKIPSQIARQYFVQEYTAARVGDVCKLSFNCLIQDNEQWYIDIYQDKKKEWHRIPASREIREIIEEQQRWIRENIGEGFDYLFCHFRGIVTRSYPRFPSLRPLPEHARVSSDINPMTKIIRLLIQNENIKDQNGRAPHFTGKITRPSKLQEVRVKYGINAAQLYAGHENSKTTFQHYTPPTPEEVARVDLPFQALLVNQNNKFLPWQSLPDSLLKEPRAHELDTEISPRLVVYGHCSLDPQKPCPHDLFPKCYGCKSFRPSTVKLPLYERQYAGEKQRMQDAKKAGIEIPYEEAKATVEAMDKWLPELRTLVDGKE